MTSDGRLEWEDAGAEIPWGVTLWDILVAALRSTPIIRRAGEFRKEGTQA